MVPIISVILPKISIDIPTAKNVKTSLVGFLMLDLIVRPTVEGNLEVNFCSILDDSLI